MEMVKTETRDRERRGFVNLLVAENDSSLFLLSFGGQLCIS